MDNSLKQALAIVKTTLPAYFKGAMDHTVRHRPVLKMIQQSGNLLMNQKAPKYVWDIEVREMKPRVLQGNGGDRHIYNQTDVWEQLEIDAVELEIGESMNRRDQAINSNNPLAIVDIMGKKYDQMVKAMSNMIARQFYVDNTTGTTAGQLTGLNSFLKPAGASTDRVAIPAAGTTYGGKSLELGDLGGWWSNEGTAYNATLGNDWPFGQGSTEYDYNTPIMMNFNANWAGDTGWTNNCLKVVRRMKRAMGYRAGASAYPTVHILGAELRSEFEDKLETRERLYVSDYGKSLGFQDIMQYEDAVIMSDFECPADRGYAINPENVCLFSVNDSIFATDESWDMPDQQSLMLVWFYGNWAQKPRSVGGYLGL